MAKNFRQNLDEEFFFAGDKFFFVEDSSAKNFLTLILNNFIFFAKGSRQA